VIADRTAYDVLKIVYLVSVTGTSLRTAGTHDPIQLVEFMNLPNAQTRSTQSVTTEHNRPKFSDSRNQ